MRPIYITSKQDNNCYLKTGIRKDLCQRETVKLQTRLAAWKLQYIQGGK